MPAVYNGTLQVRDPVGRLYHEACTIIIQILRTLHPNAAYIGQYAGSDNWHSTGRPVLDAIARTYRVRSLSLESDQTQSAYDKHKGPAARTVSFQPCRISAEIRVCAYFDPHFELFILFPLAHPLCISGNFKSTTLRSNISTLLRASNREFQRFLKEKLQRIFYIVCAITF